MAFWRRRDIGDGSPERPHPWVVSISAPGYRKRITVDGTLTRGEVREIERRLLAESAPPRGRDHLAPTVRQLVERYWAEHGRHIASWSTERSYCGIWDRALGPDRRVASITGATVSELVALWRTTRLTPSAINHRLGALQRMLALAQDIWEWDVQRIPWKRLRLHEPEPRDRSLSDEQVARFFAALPERSRLPFRMALATGLRRGGVLRITATDVDLEKGIIRTVSKGRQPGGKPTPVPITSAVAAILTELGPLPEVGRIFAVTEQQLRKDREKARRAAGLPSLTWSSLRHTFAQRLEDAGLGDVITDALHHSTPALRRRYAKARVERTREAIERSLRR